MPDVYADIKAAPRETLEAIANALETRAAIPSQRAMLQDYLSEIPFPENAEVLEVGCGTGAVCRALAAWPNVAKVVGLEPSPFLIEKARAFASDTPAIVFEEGDGYALPFADATFDVVILHTILSHTPGPKRILAEAHRVLVPGGTLGLCDGDFGTMTLQTGPHDPLQACAQAFLENFVNDRWLVRRMTVLAEKAGFETRPIRSYGLMETTTPKLTYNWVDLGADALAREGTIGPDLAAALKAEARRRAEAGSFFGYMAYAALTAQKPN